MFAPSYNIPFLILASENSVSITRQYFSPDHNHLLILNGFIELVNCMV